MMHAPILFWEEAAGDGSSRPGALPAREAKLRKNLTINRLTGGDAWVIPRRQAAIWRHCQERAQAAAPATQKAQQMPFISSILG
jgi:hypothetical protein